MAEGRTKEALARELRDLAQGEAPPPPKDPKDRAADKRAQYAFARFVAQNDYYLGFYQTWTKTVLFLLGRQWLRWLEGPRRYTADTDVPPWRQQPVTNLVYAIYRTLAAKMTKQRPTLEVVPPSGDSEDREAANLGQSVLEFLWRHLRAPQKMRRALGWYLCTGQVFLRVHWNPDAGQMIPLTQKVEVPVPRGSGPEALDADDDAETIDKDCPCDADGNPIRKEDGSYDFDAKPALVPEGDIALDYEDPMAVRYNPDAIDEDEATEMYVAKLWSKAKASRHFGVPIGELGSGDAEEREFYDNLIASGASGAGFMSAAGMWSAMVGADKSDAIGERCLVLEYYSKPCAEYPEGRHWISVGPKKVWPKESEEFPAGEAPLPNGFWPPLIPVTALPIPGQPQAMGSLAQVVPLNEQLNTLDGKIAEHEVTMAMGGKWIVSPEDNNLTIDSDPAQVLKSKGYAQGRPPTQATLKALPSEIYGERNVLLDKVRLVLSLSEADLGKRPEGVSAGRAFLVLQEVTDSVLGPDLDAWAAALEEVGRRQLILAQRYYREQRTIRIRGDNGQWEIRSFQGADLRDGMDVRVQSASMFPWSKTAQLDTKLSVLTQFKELVIDPQTGLVDRSKLARFLDTTGTGLATFESDEDPDLVEVQREHAMFEAYDPAKGEMQLPKPGFWQAHAKHLEAHYDFLKRSRARFNRWTPEAQQAFLRHCQETAMLVNQMAEQMLDATGGAAARVEGEVSDSGLAGGMVGDAQPGAVEGTPMPQGMPGAGRGMERPMLQPGDFAQADDMIAAPSGVTG